MKSLTKVLLLTISILFSQMSFAQEWTKSIKSENPTFQEIQNAFNDYWKDKPIEKGKGYKPFKRWEWFWEQRVGKNGIFPKPDILLTESQKYNEARLNQSSQKNSSVSSANWTFYGPSSSTGGYRGLGRINCIGFHPTLANTFLVGTPAGGLWKTTDGGTTWTTNTSNLPVLGISDIAVASATTLYVATGDGEGALSLQNGYGDTKSVGVLKTTNGGTTWNTTGLNWSVTAPKLIRRLIINPNNANILLAATSDGIYRTTNGGTSWTNVKSGWFMDIEFKPTDPNYVYATTYDPNGNNAQIFTSTNGGVAWTQVTFFSSYMRINLAVSANWDVLVDALCADATGGLGGLWYSSNSGASFSQYFTATCSNNLLHNSYNASGCGGQGNYDLAYAINPNNSNEIWLGGVNTWRTTDGGANWYLNNIWNVSQTNTVPEVHADKHFIAFHPLNNSFVYECNDGGLYVTNNGGTSWTDISNGLGISQIYRISATSTAANNVLCGLQDNGSKELYAGAWYEATGGDGMECIIDPVNSNTEYAAYAYGKIFKTTNAWTNTTTIVNTGGSGVDEDGNWVTPYVMHPTNNNTLLIGKSQVYQSTNGGSSWNQLGTISGATTKLIALAYAPSNPQTIYAASRYELFRTTNGGSTWTQVGTSTDAITYIAVSPTNSQKLWITNSGYTPNEKVYMSTDGGTTYTNFSGTLPNIPVNCIVYQNGLNDALYIGTDLGVYYRDGSMNDWITYNTGLPNVVVNELEISYNNNKLWAATFGRGLWRSDLSTLVGVNENVTDNTFRIYPNPVNDILNINGKITSNDKLKIILTNTLGQTLYDKEFKTEGNVIETQINLNAFSSGIYFLSITSNKGKQTFKVQKQ